MPGAYEVVIEVLNELVTAAVLDIFVEELPVDGVALEDPGDPELDGTLGSLLLDEADQDEPDGIAASEVVGETLLDT